MKYKDYVYTDGGYIIDGVFYTFEQLFDNMLEKHKDVFIRLKDR